MEIIKLTELLPCHCKSINKLCSQLLSEDCALPEAYLREVVASENSHLFLALEGESILGMLSVGVYKTPTGIKAWIEDVVVDSQARGQGLGRKLVSHAVEFAEKTGINTLMLTSKPSRVAANELYKSLGFEIKETNTYRMVVNKKS